MKIIINPVVNNEADAFEKDQWAEVYQEYFGREVHWDYDSHHFKALDDRGNILGTITFEFEDGVIFINTLIVHKNTRGLGIGEKLVGFVENWGRENKAHKIYLFTQKGWKSCDFYEKLDYKRTAVLENHFMNQDYFIYTKYL